MGPARVAGTVGLRDWVLENAREQCFAFAKRRFANTLRLIGSIRIETRVLKNVTT
jgi:hypothetical protein